MQREPGFYWVKWVPSSRWEVLEFNGYHWYDGSEYAPYAEDEFHEISPRIIPPEEKE